MTHRRTPECDFDLDDIWFYVTTRSGSIDVADRLIDSITSRFGLLARQPLAGRQRDEDLRIGLRSFPVGEYLILYRIEDEDVVILRVLQGNLDLPKRMDH